jgi:CheY-like chemotaxis protein
VDEKTNRKAEGTGLGLAITKQLVDMMDGTITVESKYGRGSLFSVRIRQLFVNNNTIGKEVADNLMSLRYNIVKRNNNMSFSRMDLSYAHILVVDDIVTNLDVVKGMLKPYGIKIDCATSGLQAIEMIRANDSRYSAIFMDHMMPGMDGIETTRNIREEIATDYARNIPIIALTANAIVGNEKMFLNNGFQDFISKPIDMTKLDAILHRWVRDKAREKAALEADGTDLLSDDGRPENTGSHDAASTVADMTIPGLDSIKALERFGGDTAALIDVLRSYAKNTRPLLSNLRAQLADRNMKDYAITIHGIKGSYYSIFAQEAGRMAEDLELAAKAGDCNTVQAGHDAFEKTERALLDAIDSAIDKIDASISKPAAAAPDPLLLDELRRACTAFDMDGVDSAMEQLEAFRYDHGDELITWLREHVNNMEFETINNKTWPLEVR